MAANSLDSNFVSMRPAVEFINVLDQYCYNEDLVCTFKFNDYTPQEGDRIAIFKLGWILVKDYVVFEWAPAGSQKQQHSVAFNRHILPKNDTEIYQICYISGDNELHGASSSFQFTSDKSSKIIQTPIPSFVQTPIPPVVQTPIPPVVQTPISSVVQTPVPSVAQAESKAELTKRAQEVLPEKLDLLKHLTEENKMLRESLKAMILQNNRETAKNYDEDIKELRELVRALTVVLDSHQQEINMLKSKIKEGGEEYKKLYLEKVKVEKKYDKLKNKKEESDKNSTETINFDIAGLKSIPPFPFVNK